jgi:hypothetical protein
MEPKVPEDVYKTHLTGGLSLLSVALKLLLWSASLCVAFLKRLLIHGCACGA